MNINRIFLNIFKKEGILILNVEYKYINVRYWEVQVSTFDIS